jgi:uncharacterized membrane protein YvbJ
MGQTKKLYEQMNLNELLLDFFTEQYDDDDYQFQEWKQQQLEEEYAAYEQHLADRF